MSPSRTTPPHYWKKEIAEILFTQAQIRRRVTQLGRTIEKDFKNKDLVVVALLNGTVLFLADFIRTLSIPLHLDFVGVSSYGSGTTSGPLAFTKELRLDVKGRDVLLLDDILDTGRTLHRVQKKIQGLKPRSMSTCVLLDKPSRRLAPVQADYVGFTIPDVFVVGYGLDFAEHYRNLPFIGVLHPRCYEKKARAS